MAKMPGDSGATLTDCGAETALFTITTTFTGPVAETSHGSCALICPDETYNSGAATPLNATVTPPSESGKGMVEAAATCGARFEPKIETSDPGETGASKLAALTTPPALTTGV